MENTHVSPTTPPAGVLQWTKTESVLASGTFRRGDFERITVRVKTVGGWREATKDEARWVLVWGPEFVEKRKAAIEKAKETTNA